MNQINRLEPGLQSELLHSFLIVARMGGTTQAAEILGRTQSAVSHQIRRLEDALGVALFERRARGMALTSAGEQLLPRAARIVEDLRSLPQLFADPVRGKVRLGLPDDYDQTALRDILTEFRAAHPGVEVSVRLALSVAFPDLIAQGALDLAIYTDRHSGQSGRTLAFEPLVWAAAADWSPPENAPTPLALFDRSCWWRDAAMNALSDAGIRCAPIFESESVRGVKAAIAAGLAIGVLSARTLEPEMRALEEKDGFPPLEPARITLLEREADDANNDSAAAIDAMAAAILRVFRRISAP